MTRQEAYNSIIARMQNPKNSERLAELLSQSEGPGLLHFHFKRVRNSLKDIQDGNDKNGLSKLDFQVSVRDINQILDEQGWA